MKPLATITAIVSMLLAAGSADAFDQGDNHFPQSSSVQQCYGRAMVGMDSVINSRIGVPAEHALDLARLSSATPVTAATKASVAAPAYSMDLLETILNAYLWDGSPHSYAISVFYECAQSQAPLRSASTD